MSYCSTDAAVRERSHTHPTGLRPATSRTLLYCTLAAAFLSSACARRPPTPSVGATGFAGQAPEIQRIFQGMGLIATGGAMPFVGSVSFLRSSTPDSTLVLVAVSMPARSLSFIRERETYTAIYEGRVEVRQQGELVNTLQSRETVRVPTFRETSRTDESIIWQQYLRLAPGTYQLSLTMRDESGMRSSSEGVAIQVPRLNERSLSTPIPVYDVEARSSLDSLPRLVSRPRASIQFGQDSIFPVYVEVTGSNTPDSLNASLAGDDNVVLWQSAVAVQKKGGVDEAVLIIPATRMGVGVTTLRVAAPGSPDTTSTRLLVSLGEDLPIASFDEMISYLRWFTTPDNLRALREAAPDERADAWTRLLRDTDPYPGTPENEAIRDYFTRIRTANQRFRDDAPIGWQSDRGTAYVALGEPDDIFDSNTNDPTARVRQQVWVYREYRLQLVFSDQSGFGRWRLNPSGMSDLQNAIRRKLAMQQQ